MNKTIYLLKSTVSVFIIFFAFYAKAEVLEATDIGIIKDEIAKLKSGDMVLLDVKHVIFYSSDQVMLHEHKSFFKQTVEDKYSDWIQFNTGAWNGELNAQENEKQI